MRVTIFTAGSRGDIQPCLVLALGLQRAGVDVLIAAPENFAGLMRQHDLPFHPLRGDVQKIMAGETGREYMESGGGNPIRSMISMRKMLAPVALQMAEDALEACRGADALISLAVFATLGRTLADICDIPLLLVEPTPILPSRRFPAPGWPVQRSLGGALNRLSGLAMLQVIWQWYRPFVNEFRGRFALPALRGTDFYGILKSVPLLGAYSPAVIPLPGDWPDSVHITGYWFLDDWTDWQPTDELERFLSEGDAPVYVGFGSMGGQSAGQITSAVVEALQQSGQRGVLATGWGGLKAMTVPDSVFVIDAAPHGWLFPRMRAVVHHGGAGTTAEGLRAGKPTVVVPFIVDQRFWGRRVAELGAGPPPVAARDLTAGRLAAAIARAARDSAMIQRAESIGRAIRAEDGPDNAVSIVKQLLGA